MAFSYPMFQMRHLQITLFLLLVTMTLRMEAGNVPNIERNPVEDILSFLHSVKTDIITFIAAGFTSHKNVKIPDQHRVKVKAPTPLQVPHHALHPTVLETPHHLPPSHVHYKKVQLPSQSLHLDEEIYKKTNKYLQHILPSELTNSESAPITDIDIPSKVQHIEKPSIEVENNNIEQETTTSTNSEPSAISSGDSRTDSEQNNLNKHVELRNDDPLLVVDDNKNGPTDTIVNTKIEPPTLIDENTVDTIPEDLWREDVIGTKHKVTNKKPKKIKKVKRLKKNQETSTPSDPQLVIE